LLSILKMHLTFQLFSKLISAYLRFSKEHRRSLQKPRRTKSSPVATTTSLLSILKIHSISQLFSKLIFAYLRFSKEHRRSLQKPRRTKSSPVATTTFLYLNTTNKSCIQNHWCCR